MCTKRVSSSYFILFYFIYILSCFVLNEGKWEMVQFPPFFPLSEGASQVFWSNFFLTSPPSKCPSLSPPNEKVASVNHLVVLFASSVEIIKEMILLLGKKMDLSKKKVRQLQEHMVICNWLKIRKKKLKRTPKVFSQYHSWISPHTVYLSH